MPTFPLTKDLELLVDEHRLTRYFDEVTPSPEVAEVDVTTFGVGAREYIAGLRDGTLELRGLYDGTVDAVHEELSTRLGTVGTLITAAPEGLALGAAVMLMRAMETRYNVQASVGEALRVEAQARAVAADGGSLDFGRSLHALTAETGAVNGSGVDHGASTAAGGVAFAHVTAFTGTTATLKVQHSSNGSTWADLLTFAAITAKTKEALTVASGTTINRHLRFALTGTFTSITFTVGFARR